MAMITITVIAVHEDRQKICLFEINSLVKDSIGEDLFKVYRLLYKGFI